MLAKNKKLQKNFAILSSRTKGKVIDSLVNVRYTRQTLINARGRSPVIIEFTLLSYLRFTSSADCLFLLANSVNKLENSPTVNIFILAPSERASCLLRLTIKSFGSKSKSDSVFALGILFYVYTDL